MTHYSEETEEQMEARMQRQVDTYERDLYGDDGDYDDAYQRGDIGSDRHIAPWMLQDPPRIKMEKGRRNRHDRKRDRAERRKIYSGLVKGFTAREPVKLPNEGRFGLEFPPAELFDKRLHDMLSLARAHDSDGEADFVQRFIMPYDPYVIDDACYMVQVCRPDGTSPPIMFSAHVDTVHWRSESAIQKIWYCPEEKVYFKKDGHPLGADNGAGCWILLSMIDARIPGTYMFHRGEECGGLGSGHMAHKFDEFIAKYDIAVAFDRRGVGDVITHQSMDRTASDAFAEALSDALNEADEGFMYSPSDGGSFTDTRNYDGLISECSNVSVGYESEHSGYETLNLRHVFALRDAVLKIDWEALPVDRVPGDDGWHEYGRYGRFVSERESRLALTGDSHDDRILTERKLAGRSGWDFEIPFSDLTAEQMIEIGYTDGIEALVDYFREEMGLR